MKKRNLIFCSAVVLVFFIGALPVAAQTPDKEALRQRIEWLKATPDATVDGAPIAATQLIQALYERRNYRHGWTLPMVQELFEQVLRSVEHGLNPDDFHAPQLGARLKNPEQHRIPTFRANTEILATDALARLGVTLKFGKLNPSDLDPAWNFSRTMQSKDPVQVFNDALDSGKIEAELERIEPRLDAYDRLQRALVRYRSIMAQGGWPEIPGGPVIKEGSTGDRVELLRTRLTVTGDLTGPKSLAPQKFDSDLEAAITKFQTRIGIDADGKVGPRTLEELNIPVDQRINQIRATLERIRWVFRDIPSDFLVADIAGFNLFLYQNGQKVWTTRIQVGKPYHATPVFRDTVRYLDFNPTWTIPPGILRKETLPAIRRDSSYLSRNNMSVVTTSGKIVDPSTIDWPATAKKGFPYMIRQEPGPHNSLGRVKFMFPNQYMVYLHDTPSKGLFSRSERTFSHGCIRTQNPFDLAEILLADQGWDRARIDRVVESRKTTRVNLDNPIPVMLLYWTAEVQEDQTVSFRRDVYSRDAAIIKGLDKPFVINLPTGAQEAIR